MQQLPFGGGMGFPQQAQQQQQVIQNQSGDGELLQYILDLLNHQTREEALMDLSKRRDSYPQLATILWFSTGVMSVLLQEIVSVYDLLDPPNLTSSVSNRVCNALALLQCVAQHPETRPYFLNGTFPTI